MKEVHLVIGIATIALNGAAGLLGAWLWWRVRSGKLFWILLRAGQVAVVLQVAIGGVLVLLGHKPSGLHVLYGVLPLLISFFAEQLRISAAQMVLDQRGFESSREVGRLPAADQQEVVVAILQRELGFMVIAALVNFLLLGRAAMTH
jgi:hypothetical protein